MTDPQQHAARIESCLHERLLMHRAAWAVHDSQPADSRDARGDGSLHAARSAAAPAVPSEAAELALQLTHDSYRR